VFKVLFYILFGYIIIQGVCTKYSYTIRRKREVYTAKGKLAEIILS